MDTEKQASQEVVQPSQEQKQEEPKSVPITETPEFKQSVQSEADKRAKVFEQKLRDVQAEHRIEMRKLQEQAEERARELAEAKALAEGDSVISKWVTEGQVQPTDAPEIKTYLRDVARRDAEARKVAAKAEEDLKRIEDKTKSLAEVESTQAILDLAETQNITLSYKEAKSIAQKTGGNTTWATDIISAKKTVTPPVPPPVEEAPKRPASSKGSGSGGKMTEQEVRQAYGMGRMTLDERTRLLKDMGVNPHI